MEITAIHNTRLSAVRKVREALLLLSLGSRFRPQHPRKVLNKKESKPPVRTGGLLFGWKPLLPAEA